MLPRVCRYPFGLDLTKVWVNFRSSVVLRFSTKVLNALLLVESQNELWGFGFRAP